MLRALRVTAFVLAAGIVLAAQAPQFDVLIRNGRIVDGSGNPWFYGDIGIVRDRITFIGKADPKVTATRTIDATGMVVAPGFIDMMGQSELSLLIDRRAVSKLTQGITSEITGEGDSAAPTDARLIEQGKIFNEHYKLTIDWRSLDEYFRRFEKSGAGINLGTFVGAATVRRLVVGDDDRAPTPEELKKMQDIVDDAMGDGALGISSALIYAPGSFAKTDELIALAKIAAKNGGIYATHMRNEADDIQSALDEAFRIGKEAGIPVEVYHIKVAGKQNWGKMTPVIASVEKARTSGLDVTADQYPYTASATGLHAVVPTKYQDGGTDKFVERLKDPAVRAAIRKDIATAPTADFENMWMGSGGPDGILVAEIVVAELKKWQGKTIAQIAAEQGKDPLDAALDLIIATHDNVGCVYFEMNEADVRLAMQQPWVAVNNDAGSTALDGPLSDAKTHPRAFGTFPRILGKYVRDEHVLTLEDAVRKFTSLPAQRVKLRNRGLLRPDYFADITIFDPKTVADRATFADPMQTSVGIEYVLVNGKVALEHGKVTDARSGRPLRGPAYSGAATSEDGLEPRGKLTGYVSDAGGWPVLRASLTLSDATGKKLATVNAKRDGRYELFYDQPCAGCKLRAERIGFTTQEKTVDYNGTNTLYFSFALAKHGTAAPAIRPKARAAQGHPAK